MDVGARWLRLGVGGDMTAIVWFVLGIIAGVVTVKVLMHLAFTGFFGSWMR